jgi:O-antigen/teichoic acid export membrane protein
MKAGRELGRLPTRLAFSKANILAPGMLDAAFASLAGLAASFYATRFLPSSELGAFGLYFASAGFVATLPNSLIYLPARRFALIAPRTARLAILRQTALGGSLFATLAALLAIPAGVLVAHEIPMSTLAALALTVAPYIISSPLQNHIRSTFHLADRSKDAALISAIHFLLTLGAVGSMHSAGVPHAWIPFTALTIGNVGSAAIGLRRAVRPARPGVRLPGYWALIRDGKLLLPARLVSNGGILLAVAVLAALTSAATLGSAEAARITARPLNVLFLGLSRTLTPRLMEAGRSGSRIQARRVGLANAAALTAPTLAFLVLAGVKHPLNPFSALIPAGYSVEGLVALTILATSLSGLSRIPYDVMVGAGRDTSILIIAISSNVSRLAIIILLAQAFGAYAAPAGLIAASAVSLALGLRLLLQVTRN